MHPLPILVVALNPAVDVEWLVDALRIPEKTEVLSERRWPGGKGVNVARWLNWLGDDPRLLIPLGGEPGRELKAGLRREAIRTRIVPIRDSTRTNIIVSPRRGDQLRLNPQWPRFTSLERIQVLEKSEAAIAAARIVVISGALPRSLRAGDYARLVAFANRGDSKVLLDCDGAAFALAIRERPFLVKPNEPELEQWAGRRLGSDSSLLKAARELSGETGGWVLVSRAHRGALLLNSTDGVELTHRAPKVTVRNTVGAGDALVAGVAHAISHRLNPSEWLRIGVVTGSVAVTVPPGVTPKRSRRTSRGN